MRSLDCVKVLTRLWGSGLGPCDGQGLLDRGCRHTWQIWHRGEKLLYRGSAGFSTAPFPRSQASYMLYDCQQSPVLDQRPRRAGGHEHNGRELSTCGEGAAGRRCEAT